MAKQTTFATPWEPHPSGGRVCLADGTIFAHDLCPTCALRARMMRLLKLTEGSGA